MNHLNPYAAPDALPNPTSRAETGVWQEGGELVATQGARLPRRCLRCNSPDDLRELTRTFIWSELRYALFFGALGAALAAKRATLTFYICETDWARRRNRIVIGCLLMPAGLAIAVFGFLSMAIMQAGEVITFLPLALGLGTFIFGLLSVMHSRRWALISRIGQGLLRLRGVHPDYLAQLPPLRL